MTNSINDLPTKRQRTRATIAFSSITTRHSAARKIRDLESQGPEKVQTSSRM